MPEPINYLAAMPQVNPMGGLLEGLKTGALLRQNAEANAAADLKEQQRIGFETDFKDYLSAPSSDKILAMQVKYPEMKERFDPIVKSMDKKQLDNDLSTTSQVLNAIKAGKTDIAGQILDSHIEAGKNSGLDTSGLENIKSSLSTNPEATAGVAEFFMANLMGPDKYKNWADAQKTGIEAKKVGVETTQMEELFPSKKKEAEAKAETAVSESTIKGVEAKYIEPKTLQAIEKTGIEMKGLLADIDYKKKMAQIAALNAQTAKEGNALKRQELQLKIQEKTAELNTKLQEKASQAQSAFTKSDNILNTIDRVMAIPKGVKQAAHGPIDARLPTIQGDVADYEALLDTLGSQAFTNVVQEIGGMSGLTEIEGNKLQKGLQNLSLSQTPEQAEANIKELKKLMIKSRKNLETKYGFKAPPPESAYASPSASQSVYDKYGIK